MFLLAQDRLDQGDLRGGGLTIDLPFSRGILWVLLVTNVLQDLEYQVRPYEVVPGETDRVVRGCVEHLVEAFRHRPRGAARSGAPSRGISPRRTSPARSPRSAAASRRSGSIACA